MDEREYPEFELEDILKEFGEDELPELSLDMEGPEETEEDGSRDTIRLEDIQNATKSRPVSQDTVPFQPVTEQSPAVKAVTGETIAFETGAEEPDTAMLTPEALAALPAHWGAEEETPREKAPRQIIAFRSKTRLRELREKLVAGPERRYYSLTEEGVGKLQAACLLHLLLFLAATTVAVLYALDMVPPDRMRLMVFVELLTMLLTALFGCYRLLEGLADLLRLRFSLKTLLVFTFAACCVDTALCLSLVHLPVSAVFCLEMLMAQLAESQKRNAEIAMMDTLRKATDLHSVVKIPDYYDGRPGYGTGEGQVEDFMDTYHKMSGPEIVLSVYGLVSLLAAVGIGIWMGITQGMELGVRAGTAVLLIAMPASAFIGMSRPMAVLEKRLVRLGTVLCGWKGIRQERKTCVYPLTFQDLFPAGSTKLNGVKFYGNMNPDTVVAYTATLIAKCGSGLQSLFDQLLTARGGYRCRVEEYEDYSYGAGGRINGQRVLVGSLAFLREMGVKVPENTKVPQAVYTAIGGELSGVFAVVYTKTKPAAAGLRTLCSYGRIIPVMTGIDFAFTESFLSSKFKAKIRRIQFPTPEQRRQLREKEVPADGTVLALTVREDLAAKAFAVTGARQLRASLRAGALVHILAGVVGIAMVAALAYVEAYHLMSAQNILLYNAIWMLPGWLITEWTRHT